MDISNLLMSLLIAILPVVLLCYYIYEMDHEKEPKELLTKTFIIGMITIIPIILIETYLQKILPIENAKPTTLFINTFLTVALIEELVKWIIIKTVIYKSKEFNYAYDVIVYSVYASLGFAVVENVIYVLSSGVEVGLLRGILSIPIHACTGIMMGFHFGKAKVSKNINNKQKEIKHLIYSLLLPATIHTIYDFLLNTKSKQVLPIFLIFVVYIYASSLIKVYKLSNLTKQLKDIASTKVLNSNIIDSINKEFNKSIKKSKVIKVKLNTKKQKHK